MKTENSPPALQFSDPRQHTQTLLAMLATMLERQRLDLHEALTLATLLTTNAHPRARSFVRTLQTKVSHPEAQKRCGKLLRMCDRIDTLTELPAIRQNQPLFQNLYDPQGCIYVDGGALRQKLVVVFTTMFNNFGIANLVLLAILRTYGVSVLLLRDCSRANYLGGASGFGSNLDEIAGNIEVFAHESGIEDIYLLGYSSGGYAACYASTRIRCAAHLGFSFPADFSPDTSLPTEFFMPRDLRKLFDRRYLVDLACLLPDSSARQRLIVGAKSKRDLIHAQHLKRAGVEVIEVAGVVHDTPESLIASGEFGRQLDWLFGVRS